MNGIELLTTIIGLGLAFTLIFMAIDSMFNSESGNEEVEDI